MNNLNQGANQIVVKITDAEFSELVSFVHKKYGIDLSKKRQLVEGRLSFTLREKNFTNFGQYLQLIKSDSSGDELTVFLNKITTNHSYFGRENEHFDFLLNVALPKLEKTRQRELRIWSAGCSSGQEAYNIAMTMHEYFGPRKAQWDTRILASDISMDVLNKAKLGIYSSDNLMQLPEEWRKKYFTRLPDGRYQVCEMIRNEVIFKTGNLMEPFVVKKPFDIIFCRNVMIYWDSDTTHKVVDKFYDATAPGGYLMIGHSETIKRELIRYTYIRPATYQKNV